MNGCALCKSKNKKIQEIQQKESMQIQDRKALCLLELTQSPISEEENIIKEAIYDLQYRKTSFSKFPIVNTEGSIEKTLQFLRSYYDQGYRIFMGFSRSTILDAVMFWFLEHPDVIGISLSSGLISTSIPKNIYQMQPSMDIILDSIEDDLLNATNIYYIYDMNESSSLKMLNLLKEDIRTSSKIKTYGISSSLSYHITLLQTFLNGSTSNDLLLLSIYDPDSYLQLYREGLNFNGKQYFVMGKYPKIRNIPNGFDGKIHRMDLVGCTTSELYRKNRESIQEKKSDLITIGNILDAMELTHRFVKNKEIHTLGGHNAIFDWNEQRELKYGSYQIWKNNEINVEYQLAYFYTEDPVYGKFKRSLTI